MDSFSEASLILSNFWGSVQSEANSMPRPHKVSLLLVENQHRRPGMPQKSMLYIPVILQAAGALAAFAHPSHVLMYAPGDSLSCRLPATRII